MLDNSGHDHAQDRNQYAPLDQWHSLVPRAGGDYRAVLRLSRRRPVSHSAHRPGLAPPSSILRVLFVLPDARGVHHRADFFDRLWHGGGARRALRAYPDSRHRHRAVGAGGRFFPRRGFFLRRADPWQPPRRRDGGGLSHLHQPGVEHGARRLRSRQNNPRRLARGARDFRRTRMAAVQAPAAARQHTEAGVQLDPVVGRRLVLPYRVRNHHRRSRHLPLAGARQFPVAGVRERTQLRSRRRPAHPARDHRADGYDRMATAVHVGGKVQVRIRGVVRRRAIARDVRRAVGRRPGSHPRTAHDPGATHQARRPRDRVASARSATHARTKQARRHYRANLDHRRDRESSQHGPWPAAWSR